MKQTLIFVALLALSSTASAGESDATFERLKTNVSNANANLADYQKNAPVVQANLNEVSKARQAAESEKKIVSANLKDTKGTLGKVEGQEAELNKLITNEKTQISTEDKKIQELQGMIAKLQENKTKRESNIQNYQQQLTSMDSDHKNWASRTDQLKAEETTAQTRVNQLKSMEATWSAKKKANDNEIYHWQRETERQRKSFSQYQSLADSK